MKLLYKYSETSSDNVLQIICKPSKVNEDLWIFDK